jgi:hypothetical protein
VPIVGAQTTPTGFNDSRLLLIILISSSPSNSKKRNGIRKTWGRVENWIFYGRNPTVFRKHTYKTVFIIANPLSQNNISQNIQKEIASNHDILLGNFTDSYTSLLVKDFMAFKWALSIDCKYILKAVDDVYVNVPLIAMWLTNKYSRIPKDLYSGFVQYKPPMRSKKPKHFLSNHVYGKDLFTPYCAGLSYLLSRNLVSRILDASRIIRPLEIDDVYIGILVHYLGVQPLEHEGFRPPLQLINSKELESFTECPFLNTFAYGHQLEPEELTHLHEIFQRINIRSNGEVVFKCASKTLAFTMSRAVPVMLLSITGLVICLTFLRWILLKTRIFT